MAMGGGSVRLLILDGDLDIFVFVFDGEWRYCI